MRITNSQTTLRISSVYGKASASGEIVLRGGEAATVKATRKGWRATKRKARRQ